MERERLWIDDPVAERIRPFFECSDEALSRLAVDIYGQCVLGKIRPPEGTLKRRGLRA